MTYSNIRRFNLYILILVLVFVFQGCGSGTSEIVSSNEDTNTSSVTVTPDDTSTNGGDTTTVPVSNPETLVESLNQLGVETKVSPRLDSQGNAYPDEYAPLGNIMTVRQIDPTDAELRNDVSLEPIYATGRPEELFLGGIRLANRQLVFSVLDDISLAGKTESEARFTTPEILEGRALPDVESWAVEIDSQNNSIDMPLGTHRDTAALDTNGDGFLDAVTAFVVVNVGGDELRLQIIDGKDSTAILDFPLLSGGQFLPVYDLQVAGGDFDGDGRDELAIALAREPSPGSFNTPVGLYIIDDADANYKVLDEYTVTYKASFAEPSVTLSLTDYHADHDKKDELALVLNESQNNVAQPGNYASRLFVFNLKNSGLQQLSVAPISAEVRDSENLPRTATAVRASVTTGDLDGDGLDELIMGGFETIVENCKNDSGDPENPNDPIKYLLFSYGGYYNNFTPIRAGSTEVFPPCNNESGSEPFIMRHVHLNVLDFDNDGDMDVQFNDLVLETVPVSNWDNSMVAFLDDSSVIYGPDAQRERFDRSDSIMEVSDQTGDGVKDILSLYMDNNENDPYIKVYTWDDENPNGYRLATQIEVDETDQGNANPILVAMDVDNDKVAQLRYTGEHFMDITEPIVLSVIATPPCKLDIGQDSCFSSWGNTLSGAVGREHSVTVSGSAGVGAGAAGAGAFGEWLVKVSASASLTRSRSYELSKAQTFSAGPGEDGVIFTSIPVDRFSYRLIHNNTDGVGEEGDLIEVRLPRSPDIRIVERGYYNASITGNAEPIDERVFQHTAGDISSYPTAAQKDIILERERSILDDARVRRYEENTDPEFDVLNALPGLEVGPVLVGQGGGATEVSLEYSETEGVSNELTMGVSFEATMIFGAAISWEVGIEFGRTLSISHGDSTLYSGSVDSIAADFYADNIYGFGLFTYLKSLGDREIEVINYWVEE